MSPRRYRAPSMTALLIILSVIAATAASIAVVLAILEHTRLTSQVQRLDDVVARLARVSHAQDGELERINRSRREAVLIVCRETEGLKLDLRLVLRRFGVRTDELPFNPITHRRAFTPTNCRARSIELVPITPDGRAGQPPAPASRGRYGIR